MTTGIYVVTHTASGRQYVGLSKAIERRWRAHVAASKRGHVSSLHQAMREHGAEAFKFALIESCAEAELNAREIHWIQTLGTFGRGFNRTRGGDFLAHTEESLAKLRGRKRTDEQRARMSLAFMGRRAPNKGKSMSEEQKAKLRIAMAGTQKGKPKSEAHAVKLRQSVGKAREARWPANGV